MKKLFPFLALAFLACESIDDQHSRLTYPVSKKVDQVDDYHGVKVEDPYRWLENDTSAETEAWVKEQNKVTFSYLEKIPFRDTIRKRLDQLLNYPRQSMPWRAGDYYFFSKNDGLQNQSVYYVKRGLDGEEKVFIDPNSFAQDGTVSFSLAGFSKDDKYVVMSKSEAGSDWQQLIVYEIASLQPTGDTLRWVKFSGATWHRDGFFYSRYPAPEEGQDYSASNSYHTVYFHKMGEDQSADQLIFQDKDNPNHYHWTSISEDEKYLFLYIAEGTDGFETYYRSLEIDSDEFIPLFTGFKHKNSIIDHWDGRFIVRTDIAAPNYRLISIDPANPTEDKWKEIIPEGEDLLQGVSTAGKYLFAQYLKNAQTSVYQLNYDGSIVREVEMPGSGSAYGFDGNREDSVVYYVYTSFTYPGTIFSFDLESGNSSVYYEADLSFNPNDYESKQVFYKSKDGTDVSMFIVHKKGLKYDGSSPCWLYGYGGFNISLTPSFKTSRLAWLENGGIFAMPNLRGGGEYGEEWHKAGMLLNKQNVFDDFIAAGEFLIKEKYTSTEKLVVEGRSNGGLLIGAVMTQRPDLMQVALPGVGVLDMLRYHKFTVGHGWIPEYGSSDNKEDFENLYRYSPLHNIKPNTDYPATLIFTGDHDDRVVPAHSFKFAATLQELSLGERPTLIRIETQAGHGGGKPISKQLDEEADKIAFAFYNIGEIPYK